MYWNNATQNYDVVNSYPEGLDDALQRLVLAAASHSRKCSYVLFGEAARWNYPERYNEFARHARSVVALTAGCDHCVKHGILEMREMELHSDGLHFHINTRAVWAASWKTMVYAACVLPCSRTPPPPPPRQKHSRASPSSSSPQHMFLYDLLNLLPSANDVEIAKAFRRASLKHHPDKSGDKALFRFAFACSRHTFGSSAS